jgi:ABC-type glycerol-3-phosphate transport system substrate-binding protein
VKIAYTPGLDREGYASQLLSVGNLPDVTWDVPIPEFVKAGALLPFNEADVVKTGAPASVGLVDGKHYSLSVGSQPYAQIFYNKTKFDQLGLKVPATWDELMTVANKIKAAGQTPFLIGSGGTDGWVIEQLLGGILINDVATKNPDWYKQMLTGQKKWTDPDIKAAVSKWAGLAKAGLINNDALSVNYSQVIAKFVNGEGLMYPMGAWAATTKAKFEIGVFPLPTQTGSQVVLSTSPAQRIEVSSKTKCPAQAQAFSVALATSPDFATAFFTSDGLIPSLPGWTVPADTSPLGVATANIFLAKSALQINPMNGSGENTFPSGFANEFDKGAQGIISGGTVDAFLKQMDVRFAALNTVKR